MTLWVVIHADPVNVKAMFEDAGKAEAWRTANQGTDTWAIVEGIVKSYRKVTAVSVNLP